MTDNAEHVRNLKWLLDDERDSDTRAAFTAAIAAMKAQDGEVLRFARVAAHLLHDFMTNTNDLGAQQAGVILAKGIKAYLASQPPKENEG